MVSDAYDEERSYGVGDLCIHNDMLYECTLATMGAWDSTKWKETTLADYAYELNEKVGVTQIRELDQNANDYTETGLYYFESTYTPANAPCANGFLQVFKQNDEADGRPCVIKQVWYRVGTANTTDYMIYVRTRFGGNSISWTKWQRLAIASDLTNLLTTDIVAVDNISIDSGNTAASTISASKSGYTPIAIAGYQITNASSSGSGASLGNLYRLNLSSESILYGIRNIHTAAINIKLIVIVLYQKN
jgi:hypothetical protein